MWKTSLEKVFPLTHPWNIDETRKQQLAHKMALLVLQTTVSQTSVHISKLTSKTGTLNRVPGVN
jgi:hypothetical protein